MPEPSVVLCECGDHALMTNPQGGSIQVFSRPHARSQYNRWLQEGRFESDAQAESLLSQINALELPQDNHLIRTEVVAAVTQFNNDVAGGKRRNKLEHLHQRIKEAKSRAA